MYNYCDPPHTSEQEKETLGGRLHELTSHCELVENMKDALNEAEKEVGICFIELGNMVFLHSRQPPSQAPLSSSFFEGAGRRP